MFKRLSTRAFRFVGRSFYGALAVRASLLRAYQNTRYDVATLQIHIGRRNPGMDKLLVMQRVREAVLITAYNPRSRLMPDGWNRRMQLRLWDQLRNRTAITALGGWRAWKESHVLVFGSAAPIRKLAREFRQNAIVIIRVRQPACLELTF